MAPFFSVIVPVLDGGEVFGHCLRSLLASEFESWELLVVDDGSDDGSDRLAHDLGARVLATSGRKGPAAARNLGARQARGEYLFFVDADCEVRSDTLATAAELLVAEPDLAALFGSYDDSPAVDTLVSQYKNLQHHWVHQTGNEEASTFWAGCGTVRRSVFEELGGFDEHLFGRPSIEDIELGTRLRRAGHPIRLAKRVQVKHHKRWTLASLLKTDLFDRGIPWTELMLSDRSLASDLNLSAAGRASGIVSWLLLASLVAAPVASWYLLWLAALFAVTLVVLNRRFYGFLRRRRGLWFLLRAIPLHWLYYLYSVAAFGIGTMRHLMAGGGAARG